MESAHEGTESVREQRRLSRLQTTQQKCTKKKVPIVSKAGFGLDLMRWAILPLARF